MGGRDMAGAAGGAGPHRAEVADPAAHPVFAGRSPRSHGALAGCHHRQVKPLGEEVPARRGARRTGARGVRRGWGAVSRLGPGPARGGRWGLPSAGALLLELGNGGDAPAWLCLERSLINPLTALCYLKTNSK